MYDVKINLFSPWYSWNIAELAFNNNHSLIHLCNSVLTVRVYLYFCLITEMLHTVYLLILFCGCVAGCKFFITEFTENYLSVWCHIYPSWCYIHTLSPLSIHKLNSISYKMSYVHSPNQHFSEMFNAQRLHQHSFICSLASYYKL
jgi:hypothetical protein